MTHFGAGTDTDWQKRAKQEARAQRAHDAFLRFLEEQKEQ